MFACLIMGTLKKSDAIMEILNFDSWYKFLLRKIQSLKQKTVFSVSKALMFLVKIFGL